jgi:hypothetical protein
MCLRNSGSFAVVAALLSGITTAAQNPVFVARPASPVEQQYLSFLQRETAARSRLIWRVASDLPQSFQALTVVLGTTAEVEHLLPGPLLAQWQRQHARTSKDPEGYSVTPLGKHLLVLAGNSPRAELYAVGWLLRNAHFEATALTLRTPKPFYTAPEKPVRGYQIGYRMKNNTYDAWTLAQFEQQMLDLAVFGLNTVQFVAPLSDDDPTSPLFPAPAQQTIVGVSRLSQQYGLRFDLYYPEMAKDYTAPVQFAAELRQFEELVKSLPRIDSVHVPGGDPGHTPPEVLLPLMQRQAEILHRYHPGAEIWVSAQGFTGARYKRFYELLADKPAWLTGVFFGPQSRESMEQQRAAIPPQYPVEFYPDTAHTMHAQFPVPQWDPIFALTEGREPIDPRPSSFEHIYKHFSTLNSGFIVYSEGVNDDVNKFLLGAWGWSASASTHQALVEYARYLLHLNDAVAERVARGIEGLEQNWTGPLLQNTGIPKTLALLESTNVPADNWRWSSILYRANYDAYLQSRRRRELDSERAALAALAAAGPSKARIAAAGLALADTRASAEEIRLHDALFSLAGKLFHQVGMQLSVPKYGASNWERGANLDRVDTPLNNRTWLEAKLSAAETRPTEAERLVAIEAITHWKNPAPGTLYDDLGDPSAEPHLVRGKGWLADPELYHTAIDGIADQTLEKGWSLNSLSYAETLYEEPLTLHYDSLNPALTYTLRVNYAGEGYTLPMRILANGQTEIQPFRLRTTNPEIVETTLPASLTSSGSLTLQWLRAAGAGGGGRGGQIAEVWLIPSH